MMINTNPTEGMRDLTPKEVELRSFVANSIVDCYKQYGFTPIETPCVEKINLLTSGDGGENEKMLFKILKRGEKLDVAAATKDSDIVDLGLRYDLTVPLCRFYANNKNKLPQQFKSIQIGSVWRAERPQKGRFRQFTQCDIDFIGNKEVTAEIQLILATTNALKNIGFSNFTVRINDRRILENLANFCGFETNSHEKVFIILDKLDKIGIDGVQQELEKSDFPKTAIDKFIQIVNASLQSPLNADDIAKMIPTIPENVLADLKKVMQTVKKQAGDSFSMIFDVSLVRGMGYYTGQIFEIGIQGYSSSIAGGGRYDKMIGKLLNGKEEIPACGFSIGFERVISILEEQHFVVANSRKKIVILYSQEIEDFSLVLAEAAKWRAEGNIVSLEIHNKKNTKKQLEALAQQGFSAFGIYQTEQDFVLKELI